MHTIAGANYFPRFETQMKKSSLLDHSCKKLTVRKISMHRMRMCGRWFHRIPLGFLLLTRFSFGAASNRFSLDAPISRVARARDFTTSRKVCSLFPALPMPHIFPASPFLSCHLIIVMKLAGNFSRNARPPVFLFHPLNVCGTRVSTASLANNRSWHFLRSHPTGSFHLRLSAVWKSRRARRWKSFEKSCRGRRQNSGNLFTSENLLTDPFSFPHLLL